MLPVSVREVARKELLEILRDKRSLFVLILLPVFLYPVLLIGMGLVTSAQLRKLQERTYTVWVDDLDQLPDALRAGLLDPEPTAGEAPLRVELARTPDDADLEAALSDSEVAAVLRGVAGAEAALARGEQAELEVHYNGGVDTSSLTRRRVEAAVRDWSDAIAARRVADAGLDQTDLRPALAKPVDRGTPGALLGRVIAALVILLAITGSFYPATDMGAGEKERGTLETLLLAPVPRVHVALGKVLAVFVVSLVSALLNLLSVSVSFAWFGSMMPSEQALAIDWALVPVMLLVMIPLVALFSALSLAASTFAASNKEAQAFLTPLMLAGMAPAMATTIPGFELDATLCLAPVLGPALLLKELLAGTAGAAQVALVLCSNLVYAALCVRWVASLYEQESVLWRPAAAGAPDLLGLQGRRSPELAQPLPSLPQALFAGLVILILHATLGVKLQQWHLVAGLATDLVFIVALPCVAYAVLLRCDLRQTFALRAPPPLLLGLTLLLAAGGIVANLDLVAQTDFNVSEEQRAQLEEALRGLTSLPLWAKLLLMAALPAICEELAFRGFVLRGLLAEGGPAMAILTSSLLFAVAHLDPVRILPTFFLGVVLGTLSWRAGSLIPAMVLHALYNGAIVAGSELEGVKAWLESEQALPPWARLGGWSCLLVGLGVLAWYRPTPVGAAPAKAE